MDTGRKLLEQAREALGELVEILEVAMGVQMPGIPAVAYAPCELAKSRIAAIDHHLKGEPEALRCDMNPISGCSDRAKCWAEPCGLAATPPKGESTTPAEPDNLRLMWAAEAKARATNAAHLSRDPEPQKAQLRECHRLIDMLAATLPPSPQPEERQPSLYDLSPDGLRASGDRLKDSK